MAIEDTLIQTIGLGGIAHILITRGLDVIDRNTIALHSLEKTIATKLVKK